jgi:hypothetical protein
MKRLAALSVILFCLSMIGAAVPAGAQYGNDCVWKCVEEQDTVRCAQGSGDSLSASSCEVTATCVLIGFMKVGDGPNAFWLPQYDCRSKCTLTYDCVWV